MKKLAKNGFGAILSLVIIIYVTGCPNSEPNPNEGEPDNVSPAIVLGNGNPVTVKVGEPYIDAGASAKDNSDGNLTVSVENNVNTSVIGTYYVIYTVTDSSGNTATATRTVYVVDTVRPVINILGDNPVTVPIYSQYVDAGATAEDNYDGNLTSAVIVSSNVNTSIVGNYAVTYSVSDSSGNLTEAGRTVNVVAVDPSVVIDTVPVYGQSGRLYGHTVGVDPANYSILGFIQVEGVWWTKPYYSSPRTTISANGTFNFNVTTGGNDVYATRFAVFVIPNDYPATLCSPCASLPISEPYAMAILDRLPPVRAIFFRGQTATVKQSSFRAGPGPNYFSDREEDVWVDDEDRLHLTVKYYDAKWHSTEVILDQSYGYGVYMIQTESRLDLLDPNIVLGEFTWDTEASDVSFRELDIEYAKWGNASNSTNAQFAVQPCNACPGCSQCSRFQVNLTDENASLTNYLIWTEGKVEFRTYYGKFAVNVVPPASALVHRWALTGDAVPVPGNEKFRFNLWLMNGWAPMSGQDTEVIISDFAYQSEIPVFDTEPPVITILGANPVTVEVGSQYIDAGATAFDAVDGDLSYQLVSKKIFMLPIELASLFNIAQK